MARQNRSTKQAEDTSTETPAPEAEASNTPAEGTEASTETPINLDNFKAAVTESLADADPSTGELPEAAVAKVNEQYRALEGQKAKNAGRAFLEAQMMEAVGQLNAQLARSYSDLKVNLSAAGGSTPKAPADPTAAFVQRVASLRIAQGIVEGSVPENVSEDWAAKVEALVAESQEQVAAQQAWLANEAEDKGDGPDLSPTVRAAFKAASGKGTGGGKGGTSSGPRGSIAEHVKQAFSDKESGDFLTIAEIAKFKSSEYPDAPPSQGAVSSRLFPGGDASKCTIEGVVPVDKNEHDGKNPKGARKA